MSQRVGVASIQGDFAKHVESLRSCGLTDNEISLVRTPEELTSVDRLIIPGGESTTVGMLMQRFGLAEAIQERAKAGMPIWGTCMGMILMARDIEDRDQFTLVLLDITARRNAFGAQVHSFEQEITMDGIADPFEAVFIRAPEALNLGVGVTTLATCRDKIVAVQQGATLGTSFHPELTSITAVHQYFLAL
jgi:5'-phosphate synthase pdxT subunit